MVRFKRRTRPITWLMALAGSLFLTAGQTAQAVDKPFDIACSNAKSPSANAPAVLPQDSCYPECSAVALVIGAKETSSQFLVCATNASPSNHLVRGYALIRAGSVEFFAAEFEHTLVEGNDPRFEWAAKYSDDLESAWEDFDEAEGVLPSSSGLYAEAARGKSRVDHARQFWQATPGPSQ